MLFPLLWLLLFPFNTNSFFLYLPYIYVIKLEFKCLDLNSLFRINIMTEWKKPGGERGNLWKSMIETLMISFVITVFLTSTSFQEMINRSKRVKYKLNNKTNLTVKVIFFPFQLFFLSQPITKHRVKWLYGKYPNPPHNM